jgi:uncharacterized protein YkwD
MAQADFFSHTGSNGSTFTQRITSAGYEWRRAAENIAAGYPYPDAAVAALLDSPEHCSNIMDPALTEIGVGKATGGGTYGTYWVQDFGTGG